MNHKKLILYIILFLIVISFNPIPKSIGYIYELQDLLTFTESDGLNRISRNTNGTRVNITNMKSGDDETYLYKDISSVGNFSVKFDLHTPSTVAANAGFRGIVCGLSNEIDDLIGTSYELACGIKVGAAAGNPVAPIIVNGSFVNEWGNDITENHMYYCYFNRSGTTLTFGIYDNEARTDHVQTMTKLGVSTTGLRIFYAAQSIDWDQQVDSTATYWCRNYNISIIGKPTDPVGVYTASNNKLNLTWTKGVCANHTVIVYNTDHYPTSKSDGAIWYNGTNTWFETVINPDNYYFIRGWSESYWSNPNDYDISLNFAQFDYGVVTLYCYDENRSDIVNTWSDEHLWSVFISDQNGIVTYENTSATNPCVVPFNEMPIGDDIVFVFNATNYSRRVYYYDILTGYTYNISAYLPPTNVSEAYLLTVNNEYDEPVNSVNLFIRKYINASTGWMNVSRVKTDNNGQVLVYLMYDNLYKVYLNKTGYQDSYQDYLPSDVLYTKTFRILFEEEIYMNETIYSELIDFDVEIGGNTLYVNFTCSDSNIVRTNISIYSINNSTGLRTWIKSDNRTGDNDFGITQAITDGMCYEVTLDLIHSIFGSTGDFRIICDRVGITTGERFDTIFDLNFKYNPFGWSNTFGFFLLLATMFSFGQQHVGISMLMTGGVLLFVNGIIGLALVTAGIPIAIICLGVMVLYGERSVKT